MKARTRRSVLFMFLVYRSHPEYQVIIVLAPPARAGSGANACAKWLNFQSNGSFDSPGRKTSIWRASSRARQKY